MEQVSHHPPVSSFYMLGPNKAWKYHGFGNYKTGGGMNSMKVKRNTLFRYTIAGKDGSNSQTARKYGSTIATRCTITPLWA